MGLLYLLGGKGWGRGGLRKRKRKKGMYLSTEFPSLTLIPLAKSRSRNVFLSFLGNRDSIVPFPFLVWNSPLAAHRQSFQGPRFSDLHYTLPSFCRLLLHTPPFYSPRLSLDTPSASTLEILVLLPRRLLFRQAKEKDSQ